MTLLVALQAFSEGFQGVFRSSERKRFCIHCFYMHVERLLILGDGVLTWEEVNQLFDGLMWEGDKPVKAKQMNLSLTWDHRVVDGAPAAEFLASVVEYLSEPYRLLL